MRGMVVGEFIPLDGKKAQQPAPTGDEAKVTVATRLTAGQHRRMKVAAARAGISLEEAYSAAVDAHLKRQPA